MAQQEELEVMERCSFPAPCTESGVVGVRTLAPVGRCADPFSPAGLASLAMGLYGLSPAALGELMTRPLVLADGGRGGRRLNAFEGNGGQDEKDRGGAQGLAPE